MQHSNNSPDNGMKYDGPEIGYNPKADPLSKFRYYQDGDKELLRQAFKDGREYERSLFSNVLATIVSEVRKYRMGSEE